MQRQAELAATPALLVLESGHTAHVHSRLRDRLVVRSPRGEVELTVRLTTHGPVLSFRAAEIDLEASGDMHLSCARLDIRAEDGVSVGTAGDIDLTAGGDARIAAKNCMQTTASELMFAACEGKVTVDAKDEIDLHGSHILLNC